MSHPQQQLELKHLIRQIETRVAGGGLVIQTPHRGYQVAPGTHSSAKSMFAVPQESDLQSGFSRGKRSDSI